MCVAHFHKHVRSQILRTSCYPLSHAVIKCILVDLHRTVLLSPGKTIASGFEVEPAVFQLSFVLSCMLRGERQLPPSIHPHLSKHTHARNKTSPYGLVLRNDVLEDRDLVVADGVALTDAICYDWAPHQHCEAVEPWRKRGVGHTQLNQIQHKQKAS